MANADKKHFGPAHQGKGAGVGAQTEMPTDMVNDNEILSNRDKAGHSRQRGRDGKGIQTELDQDHSANRMPPDET